MAAVVDFNVNTKGGGGLIEFNTLAFRKGGPVSVMTRLSVPGSRRRDEDDRE